MKPGVVEHVHLSHNCSSLEVKTYMTLFKEFRDVFSWTYEKMPRIDPLIVVLEIMAYPNAKSVCMKLHQLHPQKAATIKEEVEKLLRDGFIYPVSLMEWVSSIFPMSQK